MSDVKPIPEHFNRVSAHLIIKGAGEAMDFYKKAFGGEELCRMPGPDGSSVMYGEIKIGDSVVMVSEEWPGEGPASPTTLKNSSVTIHIYTEDAHAAHQKAVDAGATSTMPVTEMFWGDLYGRVIDPYGHHWSLATHVKDLTPEEMAAAAAAAMAQMGGECKTD